jgi:hypothetical protein
MSVTEKAPITAKACRASYARPQTFAAVPNIAPQCRQSKTPKCWQCEMQCAVSLGICKVSSLWKLNIDESDE